MSLTADTARESEDLSSANRARIEGSHRFALALGGIVVTGIVARILFIMGWTWGAPLTGDPSFFQQSAARIAPGQRLYKSVRQGSDGAHCSASPRLQLLVGRTGPR